MHQAQRRNRAKAQNATSETKKKCAEKPSKGGKVTYSLICAFACAKKREQKKENRKKRKVPTMQMY